jgi:hypothetical protein
VTLLDVLFTNTGAVALQTGTLFLRGGGTSAGSFAVSAGATLNFGSYQFRLGAGSGVSGAVVFSAGSVDVLAGYAVTGTTSVTGANTQVTFLGDPSSGAFSNAGTVTVGVGGTLTVSGTYTQTAGTTNLYAATLTAVGVNFQGGTVFASGTINGNVTNAGQLTLGGPFTPGVLTVNGNYTQAAAGTLVLKVGGPAVTQFDQLHVSGSATLSGTLAVQLIDGYLPDIGANFQVLTFASHSGDFTTKQGLSLGGSPQRHFDTDYSSPTALSLDTVAGP